MVNVSIIQFTPEFGKPGHNLQQVERLLNGVSTELIVLPELCTTGYSFISKEEALAAADGPDSYTMDVFRKIASTRQAVVVAGYAEKSGSKVYNSALIALPGGEIKVYRKSHLFFREKVCFEQGDSGFFVVNHPFKDCKIGVIVCNDWRYPEAARSLALLGADIICCPSNLVSTVWQIGMAARALENKVYFAVANRCGTEIRQLPDGSEQKLLFNGGSILYDYTGQPLAQASKTETTVFTVQIDPAATRDKHFNEFNDLLKDRRTDLYIG